MPSRIIRTWAYPTWVLTWTLLKSLWYDMNKCPLQKSRSQAIRLQRIDTEHSFVQVQHVWFTKYIRVSALFLSLLPLVHLLLLTFTETHLLFVLINQITSHCIHLHQSAPSYHIFVWVQLHFFYSELIILYIQHDNKHIQCSVHQSDLETKKRLKKKFIFTVGVKKYKKPIITDIKAE